MLRNILCLFGRHDIPTAHGPARTEYQCMTCRRWLRWERDRGGRYNPGWVRVGS